MLQQLNSFMGKYIPIITPLSVLAGVLFSDPLQHLTFLVPWVFAFMTFAGSLGSSFRSLTHSITHPLPILLAMIILHVAAPLWALGIGHLIFPDDGLTRTGMILAATIPTGITSVIWITMYGGSIAAGLSIILIDTLLSPLIVPFSLSLLIGESLEMNTVDLMTGLLIMVVIPSIAGMLMQQVVKPERLAAIKNNLNPFSKLGLPIVISINSTAVAPFVKQADWHFIKIVAVMLFISVCGYLFAWGLGLIARQDKKNVVTLIYTGGMRNISAGAVMAVSFFPAKTAVPVIVCMLFQQILAALQGKVLGLMSGRKGHTKKVEKASG